MIFETKGLVLKQVKYGETSLIATIFTTAFGVRSYLINGVRSGKAAGRISLLQPSCLLEMNVYHNELKNLQRIKEYNWYYIYKDILTDVTKNAVAMFMIEVMYKCLKQPEANVELYEFCEDALIQLDGAMPAITANYPLYFSIHLPYFFGFRLQDNFSERNHILDLQEGSFTNVAPVHGNYLQGVSAFAVSEILKAQTPNELTEIKLNAAARREILSSLENYYQYHIHDFGKLKTLPVVYAILS